MHVAGQKEQGKGPAVGALVGLVEHLLSGM
jgi:hypothetical protein